MHYTLFEGKKLERVMSLHKDIEENTYTEMNYDEDYREYEEPDNSDHKRQVRKLIEDRLERKRLREELEDELDGEFDWDELERE
jgi:regulator of sigma D